MNLDKYFDEYNDEFLAELDAVDFDAIAVKSDELIDAQEEFSDDADCEGCKI